MADTLLTVPDLMARCAISRSTAFKLARHLGAVHVFGALRVPEAALEKYITNGGAAPEVKRRCTEKTKADKRCRMPALPDGALCVHHQRRADAVKGTPRRRTRAA